MHMHSIIQPALLLKQKFTDSHHTILLRHPYTHLCTQRPSAAAAAAMAAAQAAAVLAAAVLAATVLTPSFSPWSMQHAARTAFAMSPSMHSYMVSPSMHSYMVSPSMHSYMVSPSMHN
jgi:hypothetical protein